MTGRLRVSYLSYEHIGDLSFAQLKKFGLEKHIPVDIESILDNKMGINIVPIPGYQENHEIEGSLSIDMGAIYVDEFVFKTRETRYRFTLAHEMGHIVLHKGIFESVDVGDVADWKRAYRSIDEATYFALEKQAYDFAGLILVPRSHLRERFQRLVIENKARFEEAKAKGILREQALDYFKAQAIYRLARTFIVSPEVMERRIDKDNLIAIIA